MYKGTCGKVYVGKHLYNRLKIFCFITEYVIWQAREHKGGQKLNGTHQFVHTEDINLLGEKKTS